MPLDAFGCTRVTMGSRNGFFLDRKVSVGILANLSIFGIECFRGAHEQGITSRSWSSTSADFVPVVRSSKSEEFFDN